MSTETKRRMNPEIRARWTAWLRAHVDQQTRGRLHATRDDDGRSTGFCCLGGLCELAIEDGVIGRFAGGNEGYQEIYGKFGDTSGSYLPFTVSRWAGLEGAHDPGVRVEGQGVVTLSHLNDKLKWNFNQISDIIDEQL